MTSVGNRLGSRWLAACHDPSANTYPKMAIGLKNRLPILLHVASALSEPQFVQFASLASQFSACKCNNGSSSKRSSSSSSSSGSSNCGSRSRSNTTGIVVLVLVPSSQKQ